MRIQERVFQFRTNFQALWQQKEQAQCFEVPFQWQRSTARPCPKKKYKENKPIYDEINTLVFNNIWLNYFLNVYNDRKIAGKKGWIDFENEISQIIQVFDEVRKILIEKTANNKSGRIIFKGFSKKSATCFLYFLIINPKKAGKITNIKI